MSSDFVREIETRELVEKLVAGGYGHVVEAFLTQSNLMLTRGGRLNQSSSCRNLGVKNKTLKEMFKSMRAILGEPTKADIEEDRLKEEKLKELELREIEKAKLCQEKMTKKK